MSADRIIPIPLRADGTLARLDLPRDLTPSEARKIANVVLALGSGALDHLMTPAQIEGRKRSKQGATHDH